MLVLNKFFVLSRLISLLLMCKFCHKIPSVLCSQEEVHLEALTVVLSFSNWKMWRVSETSLGHLHLRHTSPGHRLSPAEHQKHEKLLSLVRAFGDREGREALIDIVLLKQRGVHLKQILFYIAKLPQLPSELAQYRHLLIWQRWFFKNWLHKLVLFCSCWGMSSMNATMKQKKTCLQPDCLLTALQTYSSQHNSSSRTEKKNALTPHIPEVYLCIYIGISVLRIRGTEGGSLIKV